MTASFHRSALLLLLALLGACSRPQMPTPGEYRAYVELRGGQAPFALTIEPGEPALLQVGDIQAPAQVMEGALQAQLPGIGSLHATLGRKSLKGELRMTDAQGVVQALPFAAELGQSWRFVEQASTDNVDVSGSWQLEALTPGQFATPLSLQLSQNHADIQGTLLDGQPLKLYGQANGDEVYLSGLGQGRALLFKGRVNNQGELQGELWINLGTAQPAVARRTPAMAATEEDTLRQITLPWAVPTRPLEQIE